MKKSILGLLIAGSLFASCASDDNKKTTVPAEKKVEKNQICHVAVEKNTAKLSWTAFKTTEKLAVKGVFDAFDIESSNDSRNIEDLIKTTNFSVKTSSINSGNEGRDAKLEQFFFGSMNHGEIIKGSVKSVEKNIVFFDVFLNDKKAIVPFKYTFNNDILTLNGEINLNDFNGEKAIDSLNKVCNEKHKGKDGISKTWPNVDIAFSAKIVTVCK